MSPWRSDKQRRWGHAAEGIKALGGRAHVAEWDAASKKSKKKPKFVINNKIKGYGQMDTKTNLIEINKKKHKGDRRELADTIKHEWLHVKHPKMHEKMVYKKTGEISRAEQDKLIAKLRMKKLNYKSGAIKRKLKIHAGEKTEPGTFISKMNAQKAARPQRLPKNPSERTAIMGSI